MAVVCRRRGVFSPAPELFIDLSTGINPLPYPVAPIEPSAWTRLPEPEEIAALDDAAARTYGVADGSMVVALPGTQLLISLLPRLSPQATVELTKMRARPDRSLSPVLQPELSQNCLHVHLYRRLGDDGHDLKKQPHAKYRGAVGSKISRLREHLADPISSVVPTALILRARAFRLLRTCPKLSGGLSCGKLSNVVNVDS